MTEIKSFAIYSIAYLEWAKRVSNLEKDLMMVLRLKYRYRKEWKYI